MDGEATQYGLIKYFLLPPNQSVAVVNRLIPTKTHCHPQGLGILCSRIVPVLLENSIDVIPVNLYINVCTVVLAAPVCMYNNIFDSSFTDNVL